MATAEETANITAVQSLFAIWGEAMAAQDGSIFGKLSECCAPEITQSNPSMAELGSQWDSKGFDAFVANLDKQFMQMKTAPIDMEPMVGMVAMGPCIMYKNLYAGMTIGDKEYKATEGSKINQTHVLTFKDAKIIDWKIYDEAEHVGGLHSLTADALAATADAAPAAAAAEEAAAPVAEEAAPAAE